MMEKKVIEKGIEYKLGTMVLDITEDKRVIATNSEDGIFEIEAICFLVNRFCSYASVNAKNAPSFHKYIIP